MAPGPPTFEWATQREMQNMRHAPANANDDTVAALVASDAMGTNFSSDEVRA
jgi:hypothetical protein